MFLTQASHVLIFSVVISYSRWLRSVGRQMIYQPKTEYHLLSENISTSHRNAEYY